jgi:uncharacterized protein YegP (UPF0339 family)
MGRVCEITIYKDSRGEWRWRLTHWNGNILATSSEGYHNLADCEDIVNSLWHYIAEADVINNDIAIDDDDE